MPQRAGGDCFIVLQCCAALTGIILCIPVHEPDPSPLSAVDRLSLVKDVVTSDTADVQEPTDPSSHKSLRCSGNIRKYIQPRWIKTSMAVFILFAAIFIICIVVAFSADRGLLVLGAVHVETLGGTHAA